MPAPDGFAVQRLYSPRHGLDVTETVRDGDLMLVPFGYHTTAAAHGYDLYYLNALAGDRRSMAAADDPELAWVRPAWETMEKDPRVPLVTLDGPRRGQGLPHELALRAGDQGQDDEERDPVHALLSRNGAVRYSVMRRARGGLWEKGQAKGERHDSVHDLDRPPRRRGLRHSGTAAPGRDTRRAPRFGGRRRR